MHQIMQQKHYVGVSEYTYARFGLKFGSLEASSLC